MRILETIFKERSPVAIIAMMAGFAVACWFFWQTRVIWSYVLIAVGISYLMSGPVNALSDRGLPRVLSVSISFLVLIGIIILVVVLLVPNLVSQVKDFGKDVPGIVADAQMHFKHFETWLDNSDMPRDVKDMPDRFWKGFQTYSGNLLERGVNLVFMFFSRFYAVIIIPICTFYMLMDVHKFHESFLNIFSSENKQKVDVLLERIDTVFGGFIRSRLKLCLVVGIGMIPLLLIFKVPYAVILGLIAGVCEFVPYVGPLIGAIPALIVGLIDDKFIAVLLIVLAVQVLENAVFVPKIMGTDMGLHPLVVILALLAGGELGGAGGMILSVPLVAAGKILAQFFIEQADLAAAKRIAVETGVKAGEPPAENGPGGTSTGTGCHS